MKKELGYLIFTFSAIIITFITLSAITNIYTTNNNYSDINQIQLRVNNLNNIVANKYAELTIIQSNLNQSQEFYNNISADLETLLLEYNATGNLSSLRDDLQLAKQKNANLKQQVSLLGAQLK